MINIFLEAKEKNLIYIANFLFERQGKPTTINDIAKRVRLTTQKVNKLLEYYRMSELSKCGIKIKVIEKKNIYYEINEYSENRLQQLLIRKNNLFVLCKELFNHTFENLDSFANENFTSVPTLGRELSKLKQLLKSYDVMLDLRNGNYFNGKEHRIRHFFFELFYLAYGLTDDYSSNEWEEDSKPFEDLEFPDIQRIKIMGFIMEKRTHEGKYIEEDFGFSPVHNLEFNENGMRNLCLSILPNELSNHQKELELDFFFMYMVTFDVVAIDQFETIVNLSVLMGNVYFEEIKEWMILFSMEFRVNISSKVYFFLIANLYYHLFRKAIIEGESQIYLEINDYSILGNEELSFSSKKMDDFLESIYVTFPDSMTEKAFYSMLIREALVNSRKDVTICIFSGTAQTHKRIIEENIKKYSLVPVRFDDFITEKVDLIVSDSYFKSNKSDVKQDEAILFISKYPSLEEYSIVIKKVLHIFENKNKR